MNTIARLPKVNDSGQLDAGGEIITKLQTKAEIFAEVRHLICRRDQQRKLIKHYNTVSSDLIDDKLIANLMDSVEQEYQLDRECDLYLEKLKNIFVAEMRDRICYNGQEGGTVSDDALEDIAYGWLGLIYEEMKGSNYKPKDKTFSV